MKLDDFYHEIILIWWCTLQVKKLPTQDVLSKAVGVGTQKNMFFIIWTISINQIYTPKFG